jgi:outer membrane receptor for ferric coprogen and ferric-rhodotorulic acid
MSGLHASSVSPLKPQLPMHPSRVTPRAIFLRRPNLNARLRPQAFALLTSLALASAGNAQAPSPRASESNTDVEPIRLDPLMVTSSASGYGAQLSSSSSRLNIRYVEVPQTVSVVTSEFLKDAFIFDSHDFVKFVNNVYPRTNTHQVETYYIRGMITSNSYVDGMLSTFPMNRDAALYDRVEYVKGPASAAMGRGEAGGLVNFVSKRPTRQRGNRFDLIAGTDDFRRAEFDHEGVITRNGRLAYRIPFYYEKGDNPRGGNLLALEKYGIGPSLLWDISPQTQLSATASFTRFQGLGNVGEMWWTNVNVYRSQTGARPVGRLGVESAHRPFTGAQGPGIWFSGTRTKDRRIRVVGDFDAPIYRLALVSPGRAL